MDFGSYPPEVNSARMYAGAGSGPLLAAAEGWDVLGTELHSAANAYHAVASGLTTGPWLGPASASMSAAATSYVAWLRGTAAQAEETAAQARAAAAAYQAALSATVPPQLVTANRAELMTLIATNLFGRNTPAIAATEAQYAQMWAQDLAAMYSYAASSASATALMPFHPPPQTADPRGLAEQATGIAGVAERTVQQAFSAVPSELLSAAAATPAAAEADPVGLLADVLTILSALPAAAATFFVGVPSGAIGVTGFPVSVIGAATGLHTDEIVSGWAGQEPFPGTGPAPVEPFPATLLNLPPGTVPQPSPSAALGEAKTVGALSVPRTWTLATPSVRAVSYTMRALDGTAVDATAAAVEAAGSNDMLAQVAAAGMAGRALGATVVSGRRGDKEVAKPRRRTVAAVGATAAPDTAAPDDKPRAVVTGIAAELREFIKLHDQGFLTDEEYARQKNRLLGP